MKLCVMFTRGAEPDGLGAALSRSDDHRLPPSHHPPQTGVDARKPALPETRAMTAPTTSAANEYHVARATPRVATSAVCRASCSASGRFSRFRVDGGVTAPIPHRPGRAQLRHPVLHCTDSLTWHPRAQVPAPMPMPSHCLACLSRWIKEARHGIKHNCCGFHASLNCSTARAFA
jgi:hypothetical protein